MQTVIEKSFAEYEAKKSKFIAHLVPYAHFQSMNQFLREEHSKANHVVWAYRTRNEYGQVVENSSDDGEPKGTSGPPVLNVMRGGDLIECAILVVRYFGGIRLGTGGLVRAYGTVANGVIAQASLIPFESKTKLVFKTEYPLVQRVEHYFAKQGLESGERQFEADGVRWEVMMTQKEESAFKEFASIMEGEELSFD
jgi:uncharacterized YigZ family protein